MQYTWGHFYFPICTLSNSVNYCVHIFISCSHGVAWLLKSVFASFSIIFFRKPVFLETSSSLNIYVMEPQVVRNTDWFISVEYPALFHTDFKPQLHTTVALTLYLRAQGTDADKLLISYKKTHPNLYCIPNKIINKCSLKSLGCFQRSEIFKSSPL